jgi:deazaflavin-dependent oxidoreductase (nitroreductase family)
MMAGPHWHPVLTESFAVEKGRVRFRVDGREFALGPGEFFTVRPGEVHRFWNSGGEPLVMMHLVRPPGRHRAMFELWHRLDVAGKTNRQGVPTNPLALGLLWERQDGYVAGIPEPVQRLVFGGLVRLARLAGYEARWSTRTGPSRTVGSGRSAGLRPGPTGVLRHVLHLPVYLYRLGLGRLLGHRFLPLTHRGRKSGRAYETVLEVVHYEPSTRETIAVSGRGEKSDWFRNITAHPAPEVRTGSERYAPEQRFLTPEEVYAEIADYERRHPWAVRVVPPSAWLRPRRLGGGKQGLRRLLAHGGIPSTTVSLLHHLTGMRCHGYAYTTTLWRCSGALRRDQVHAGRSANR